MPYRNDALSARFLTGRRWVRNVLSALVLSALVLMLCAAGATGAPSGSSAPALVERISFAERADGQGYVVRVHAQGRIGAYAEPRVSGAELEWTLFNADLAGSFNEGAALGPVQDYSVEAERGHLVLRFRLRSAEPIEAAAYRDRESADLLLGLSYAGDEPSALPTPATALAGSEERPTWAGRTPMRETAAPSPDRAEAPPAAGRGSAAGERWKLNTVVIDAGHGGKDPGAQAHGLREKDVTLGIALKLGRYIEEKMPGVGVVYTRSDDRFVTLRDRGHIANQSGGKLFVSIHVNAARNRAAEGTETYFLGTHKTAAAQKVMERENAVVRLEENPEQYEDLDEQKLILQTLAQSAYMRQSEHLAEAVQEQFTQRVGRKSRGVKQAGFLVLWGASMPAILVETGFVTNAKEARFLGSDEGQTYLASAIFRAIRDFKEDYERGLNLTLGE